MTDTSSNGIEFRDLVRALRPSQWTKNLIVIAAFFFAYGDRARSSPLSLSDVTLVIPAMMLFCVISSAVYVINDISDVEADRHHPQKSSRPIAAGRISIPQAWVIAVALLLAGLAGSYYYSPAFLLVVAAYVAIQIVYTFFLKRIALLDVMIIASGFVLRAIGGAVPLVDVTISPWLLLCTFLLALFLALCKRRHEKILLSDRAEVEHRPSLAKYDEVLLDQLINITGGATVVTYAIYTLWPATVEKFGTSMLGFTVPFVVFGVFRYLDLVYRHEKGGRPEKILLTDLPMIIDIALYGITVLGIFLYLHSPA